MNIRLATIEDAAVLTAMGRDFMQYSEYRNIQVTDEQLQAGIAQIIAFECSFVAEMDGRVIGAILGVTIVAPRASEMISLFTLAIQQGSSLYALYRVVYPYPTFSSGIQKVADAFLRETLPALRGELVAYLRYRWARPIAPAEHPADGC